MGRFLERIPYMVLVRMVGVKKSSHLPSVQRDRQYRAVSVPFPFNFHAVAVIVRFQTVPVLSQGSTSILVNGPDGKIKRAWSLIAQECSRQFGDRDRARAKAT